MYYDFSNMNIHSNISFIYCTLLLIRNLCDLIYKIKSELGLIKMYIRYLDLLYSTSFENLKEKY